MKRPIALLLCIVLLMCTAPTPLSASELRDMTVEEGYAVALKQLGLFKGVSDTDFDLDRAPTRVEALVMLIRVLGKEKDAMDGKWEHPFGDVPSWADGYVGYAYTVGLSNGISQTEFGSGDATAAMYLTFVLRALGYSDKKGADFTRDAPFELAKKVGILTEGIDTEGFLRADVAAVSYNALSSRLKDSETTLAEKLITDGAFTEEAYLEAVPEAKPADGSLQEDSKDSEPSEPLTANEIYSAVNKSVFRITGYNVSGQPCASASGFFIDENGTGVTTVHSLYDTCRATATLWDGTVCDIAGIHRLTTGSDHILIKVITDASVPVKHGDSDKLSAGDKIYGIGSPKDPSDAVAEGIIASASSVEYDGMIQITSTVAEGCSGGVLVNEYGEAVGVQTSIYYDDVFMNFAVPFGTVKAEYEEYLASTDVKLITFEEFAAFCSYVELLAAMSEGKLFGSFEVEPNDTPEQAPTLYSMAVCYGTSSGMSDDCVLFRCNSKGIMALGFVLANSTDTSAPFELSFYNVNGGEPLENAYNETQSADVSSTIVYGFEVTEPGVYCARISFTEDAVLTYGIFGMFMPDPELIPRVDGLPTYDDLGINYGITVDPMP